MKLSEAKEMFELGYMIIEIAREAKVTPKEVREALGLDAAYVKKLYDSGHSRVEIQRLTGASYTWVDNRLKEVGIGRGATRPEVDWSLAPGLYNEGKNDTEIALELGCTSQAVYKWRRQNGLKANWRSSRER